MYFFFCLWSWYAGEKFDRFHDFELLLKKNFFVLSEYINVFLCHRRSSTLSHSVQQQQWKLNVFMGPATWTIIIIIIYDDHRVKTCCVFGLKIQDDNIFGFGIPTYLYTYIIIYTFFSFRLKSKYSCRQHAQCYTCIVYYTRVISTATRDKDLKKQDWMIDFVNILIIFHKFSQS